MIHVLLFDAAPQFLFMSFFNKPMISRKWWRKWSAETVSSGGNFEISSRIRLLSTSEAYHLVLHRWTETVYFRHEVAKQLVTICFCQKTPRIGNSGLELQEPRYVVLLVTPPAHIVFWSLIVLRHHVTTCKRTRGRGHCRSEAPYQKNQSHGR